MTKQSQARPAWRGAVVLAVGAAALLGACSSSGGGQPSATATPSKQPTSASPSATPSATPSASISLSAATCQHVKSLDASVQSLTQVSLNAGAASQIRTDLTNIQAQLTALKTENTGALSTQLTQLSASLQQVEAAAKGLSSNPSASQISAIVTALSGLKGKASGTVAQLHAACP